MTVMAQAVETKTAVYKRPRPKWRKWAKAVLAVALCAALFYHALIVVNIFRMKGTNPEMTAIMKQRAAEASDRGETPRHDQTWVAYDQDVAEPRARGAGGRRFALLRSFGL